MEIRQLRYLVALAEERNFTRAAARAHVAQPALSQQIRRMEDELGLPLVERSTRRVALTDAGELLVLSARRILSELETVEGELRALRGVEAGHVTVGAMHTMGPVDISLALAAFHDRRPAVELTVREQASGELADLVRLDEIDLAFLSVTERVEAQGLALHRLVLEELVAVVPPGHALAGRNEILMTELRGEQFISYRTGSRLRELLMAAGEHAGFTPEVKLESNESGRIRRLVSRGLGVAILPRSDAEQPGAEVAVADLREPELTRDITLAWREGRRHSPAAREFLRLSRELFAGAELPGPGTDPAEARRAPPDGGQPRPSGQA